MKIYKIKDSADVIHSELEGKDDEEILDMLEQEAIEWMWNNVSLDLRLKR